MKEMINDVYINGIKIDLTRPLEIDIGEIDEAGYKYMVSNEEFHIYGIGKTKEDAINDLKKHFDFLYKEYGLCSDNKLEKLALEYKKKVLQIIGADSDIWIVPLREMAYEDAKSEIIEYRNNCNYNTWISELVEALWLDIELVTQIVEDIDKEYQFRWC